MANIMSQVKLKNNVSRNAFDLSRKNAFTAKVGELLPVACIECLPGDKIKGRVQHFTRTTPVNTAAYTRIREYYDWFFVPTNLLWNKFNTFVTQMKNNSQHATNILNKSQVPDQHPYFTVNQLQEYLQGVGSSQLTNMFGYSRAHASAKLLEYLDYGNFYDAADGSPSVKRNNLNLNPFPLLAYQKIYQDYYRNSQWEDSYAPTFNLDYITGDADLNINLAAFTSGRLPGIETMFDLRYSNWHKDLFMGVMPNSQYGDAASVILDSSVTDTIRIPYSLYTSSFNSTGVTQAIQNPSDTNSVSTNDGRGITTVISPPQLESIQKAIGGFSILALRQAEALQKWQEITQSQQQDYKNQIEAHFGVSMSDAYSERCRYVDGSVSSLDISEVVNTNLQSQGAAAIAGKGVGVGNGKINFKTDVHGYLMCIYHAVPLLDYASDGVPRMLSKTMATDYAIPEFDKCGMVQVPTVELTNSVYEQEFPINFLGYAPRYYDYKTAVDRVHGAFVNGGLGAWVAPVDNAYLRAYMTKYSDQEGLSYPFFKVNPSVLNPIFMQDAGDDNTTDQLLINAGIDITAVRNLDRNGLPY